MGNNSSADGLPHIFAIFTNTEELLAATSFELSSQKPGSACLALEFYSEGGANVVYALRSLLTEECHYLSSLAGPASSTIKSTTLPQRLQNKVLRVRKHQAAAQEDADTTPYVPTADVERYLHGEIQPRLGPQYLVKHDMIRIDPKLIEALNSSLALGHETKARAKGRRDDRLNEDEPHALLLDDMRPEPGVSFMIEFKPKWLADSPNPGRLNRKRCRTCALRAMRNAAKAKKFSKAPVPASFCPLSLTSTGPALAGSIDHFLADNGVHDHPLWVLHGNALLERLIRDFTSGTSAALLSKLQRLEKELDVHGCLAFTESQVSWDPRVLEDLALAMTLRDCTIFARLTWDQSGPLEVKVADLDRKDVETRLERWCSTERDLLDGGWYTGTEDVQGTKRQENVCQLWNS